MATEKTFTKGLFANEKASQYGNFMNVDINVNEFIDFLKANTNEKGYCKITLYKNREGSGSKNSHYGVLNDWKKPEEAVQEVPKGKMQEQVADDSSDLPF